jgi:hypothetical protein
VGQTPKSQPRGERTGTGNADWPAEFRNRETGKVYAPHSDDERLFVYSRSKRYSLAKGGEGAGKSVSGIVKDLDNLRLGMNGILTSPDFEHFKKSLWPEFRRWCPLECLVEKDRYRLAADWEPRQSFELHFMAQNGNVSTLYCGGIEDPASWEGPNVSFAHLDEARRKKNAEALKVLDGRVRIPGPKGEMPQLYFTTTPRKNWLFEYFGPVKENDPRAAFKADSLVVTLYTEDNERAGNLEQGYTQKRAQSLSESEVRVLLRAEWEDIDDVERFLPSMAIWESCKEQIPALTRNDSIVIAADAGITSDSFGLVGVSRHPHRENDIVERFVYEWKPNGKPLDFMGTSEHPGPERVLRWLCGDKEVECSWGPCPDYNVVVVCYDPYQLHDMMTRLTNESIVWCKAFSQAGDRLEADKQLYDLITQRRLVHDGDARLREHIDNADRKPDPETRKMRIVKREQTLKIDLAVCLSMASYTCLRLNV